MFFSFIKLLSSTTIFSIDDDNNKYQQISILEWFLKDRVACGKDVENSALASQE